MAESWNWTQDSKLCFVTTGATAPFTELLESVLSPPSLQAFRDCGFTHVLVQYGTAKDVFDRCLSAARLQLHQNTQDQGLIIGGLDFDSNALRPQFKLVQKSKGLVISHAGSGTILAALRYQIPLIVVPNTGLLDNHQEELASAMERNRYVLRGDVNDLAPAIRKSEEFRTKMAQFPPVTSGEHRDTKSFAAIMDDTLGYMD